MERPLVPAVAAVHPRGWSLDRRLPVLIFVLLVGVVGGLGFAAYREVRRTAINRATDRLERAGREFLSGATRSTDARTQSVRDLAADSLIVRAATAGADQALVAARLAAARQPADSTLVAWQISSLDGTTRFASPDGWSAADSSASRRAVAEALRTGVAQRSPFYAVGTRAHTWAVAPILVRGRPVAAFAELLRVGDNRSVDDALHSLLDVDARMLFTSRGDAQWVTPRGRPVGAPFALPRVDGRAVRLSSTEGTAFAAQFPLPGTPWLIVIYQSEASVLRRPKEFLSALLGAGVFVLASATAGAWLLSRHVTRPLREMTDAAAAVAAGDYSRRVHVSGGGREIATLATTFNAMAAAIGDAHEELADRNLELRQANATKAQFLAMMSHELRTPLNAIGGFTELLQLGLRGPLTPEQREDLGRIQRNKEMLLAIIGDILEFSRTDAGALSLRLESVAVAPLLRDVVELVGHQLGTKGVRLSLSDVPDHAIARADRARLRQVVLNLLSNALKFTEAGGEVGVGAVVADGVVRIDVQDTGRGIDAEHLEAIFEPFVQLDASLTRRAGGTGLGLAIARQLTAAMGGSLAVRSSIGRGSTFSLTLPRAVHPEASAGDLAAASTAS